MRKDDSSLKPEELQNVKKYVRGLLLEADALGEFPTPVDRLVTTAKLAVNENISLGKDESFISKLTGRIGKVARPHIHSMKKVLGLLYVPAGEILLDHDQHPQKKKFIKLHETGHGCLPHHRKMYEFMEDTAQEIHPDVDDTFEREANNFAAETMFQLDKYEIMAADYQVSIETPMTLSKTFGSSVYSSMRRYVQTHFGAVALAVYDKLQEGSDHFQLRRASMYSGPFIKQFGMVNFPNPCSQNHFIGDLLRTAKLQKHHVCGMRDLNGDTHEVAMHIFCNSYEKFIMLIPIRKCSANGQAFYLN